MTVHRYPRSALRADAARGLAGLALCATPALVGGLPVAVSVGLGALCALFAGFLLQVAARRRTVVRLEPDALVVEPGPRRIPWGALERFRLSFYSVRRDGARGWMELRAWGAGCSVRVDSRLEGFGSVARRVSAAAGALDLPIDPATAANLESLGLRAPGGPPVGSAAGAVTMAPADAAAGRESGGGE